MKNNIVIDSLLWQIGVLREACKSLESRGNAWRGLFRLQAGLHDLEDKAPGDTAAALRLQIVEIAEEMTRIENEAGDHE